MLKNRFLAKLGNETRFMPTNTIFL